MSVAKSQPPPSPPSARAWPSPTDDGDQPPSRLAASKPWERPAIHRQFVNDIPKDLGNGPDAPVWPLYLEKAEQWDRETVEQWDKGMDVLLIFSALFSAVLAAFLVYSLPYLAPDNPSSQLDALATISAQLRAIASGDNTDPPEAYDPPEPFTPSNPILWMNALWLIALVIALYTAVLAMLVKEWVRAYDAHLSPSSVPQAHARERHFRHMGMVAWKVQDIAESLPMYLHMAVLSFVIGLTVYLWSLHSTLAILMTVLTVSGYTGYFMLGVFPLIWPTCPYNSGFTRSFEGILSLFDPHNAVLRLAKATWNNPREAWRTFFEFRTFAEILEIRHSWLQRRAATWIRNNVAKLDTSAFGWLERACQTQGEKEIVLCGWFGWRPYAPLWRMVRENVETVAAAGIRRLSWSGEIEWDKVEPTATKLAIFSTFAPEKFLVSHPPAWHEQLWAGLDEMVFEDEAARQRALALRVWCADEQRVGSQKDTWDGFHGTAVHELVRAVEQPMKTADNNMEQGDGEDQGVSVFATWLIAEDARMDLVRPGRHTVLKSRVRDELLPAMDGMLASSAPVPAPLVAATTALWEAQGSRPQGHQMPSRLSELPELIRDVAWSEPMLLNAQVSPDQELAARSYLLHNLELDHALRILDVLATRFKAEMLVYPDRQAPLPVLDNLQLSRQVDLELAEACIVVLLRHRSTWHQVRFSHLQLIALTSGGSMRTTDATSSAASPSISGQDRLLAPTLSNSHPAHAGVSQDGLRAVCRLAIESPDFTTFVDCARQFSDSSAASFASLLLYNGYSGQYERRVDPILKTGWLDLLREYGFRSVIRGDPELSNAIGDVLMRFSDRNFEYLEKSGVIGIMASDGWQFEGVQDLLDRGRTVGRREDEVAKELEEGRNSSPSYGGPVTGVPPQTGG